MEYLAAAITWIVLTVIRGTVVAVLWFWFMVPLGVPQINAAWAIGLTILGRLVLGTREDSVSFDTILEYLLGNAIILGLVLAGAWLVRSFM